jgi:hypothetical protein
MNKFASSALVSGCAVILAAVTPFSAQAVSAAPPGDMGEVSTGCDNGTSGYVMNPDNTTRSFETVPGTEYRLGNHGPGVYRFFTNQPEALPAYGPGMGGDRSAPFATEGVDGAIVNLDNGASMRFFNDRADGFQFNVPAGVHHFDVYYKCSHGRS